MTRPTISLSAWPKIRPILIGTGFTIIVVLLMMWLAGVFHEKIGERPAAAATTRNRTLADRPTAKARTIRVPAMETSVGTVRAQHEAAVASKILARVVAVTVRAGQRVSAGEVLVRLDDEDLAAREKQAVAAVEAATARRDQARIARRAIDGRAEHRRAAR